MDEADSGGTDEEDEDVGNELEGGVYVKDAGRGAIYDGGRGATLIYTSARSAKPTLISTHRYSRSSQYRSFRTISMISSSYLRHCIYLYLCD